MLRLAGRGIRSPCGDDRRRPRVGRMMAGIANIAMVDTIVLSGEGVGLWNVVGDVALAALAEDRDPEATPVEVHVDDAGFVSWARGAAAVAIQAALGRLRLRLKAGGQRCSAGRPSALGGTRRRRAHAQLVRQRRRRGVRRGIRFGLELLHEDLDRLLALQARELRDRRQAEEVGEVVVVDAHDRHVARHDETEVARREDRADGHLVGCREDRGGAVVRHTEQLLGRVVSAADREVRRREQALVDFDAGVAKRSLVADATVRGQVEVEVELELAADVRDARCPRAMRCSVASRATAMSSMVSVRTPGIGPPTPTSGLPRSCRRATSCSVSSSEIAITASTRCRSRKCSNTLGRSSPSPERL